MNTEPIISDDGSLGKIIDPHFNVIIQQSHTCTEAGLLFNTLSRINSAIGDKL
jgi:hypothetical protein